MGEELRSFTRRSEEHFDASFISLQFVVGVIYVYHLVIDKLRINFLSSGITVNGLGAISNQYAVYFN